MLNVDNSLKETYGTLAHKNLARCNIKVENRAIGGHLAGNITVAFVRAQRKIAISITMFDKEVATVVFISD